MHVAQADPVQPMADIPIGQGQRQFNRLDLNCVDVGVWCQSNTYSEVDITLGQVEWLPGQSLDDVLVEIEVGDFADLATHLAVQEGLEVPVQHTDVPVQGGGLTAVQLRTG